MFSFTTRMRSQHTNSNNNARRREWEDATKRAVGARQNTLVFLTELLTTAAEVGAEDTALAANLR